MTTGSAQWLTQQYAEIYADDMETYQAIELLRIILSMRITAYSEPDTSSAVKAIIVVITQLHFLKHCLKINNMEAFVNSSVIVNNNLVKCIHRLRRDEALAVEKLKALVKSSWKIISLFSSSLKLDV